MDIKKNKKSELAFPSEIRSYDGSAVINLGMSLRDYFAAKAMQGLTESAVQSTIESGEDYITQAAGFSYKIADEMLKARGE